MVLGIVALCEPWSEVLHRYGVAITHVRLSDTAEAVTRVISERAAGRDSGGSVDLIWINGPNFLAMKEQGLLFGPFVGDLPNAQFVDLEPPAPAALDFTVPVGGRESPWRLARCVFRNVRRPSWVSTSRWSRRVSPTMPTLVTPPFSGISQTQ